MKVPVFLISFFVLCPAFSLDSSLAYGVESDTVALQEIIVTDIKQGINLKHQPVAATVIGQLESERLNMATIRNISDVVPNFYMPEYGSRITSSIYVRGIGARMEQPVVGLNVDNVPFLNKDAYDFDLIDISSVEVLRGPQSTLYGRNTMGGVVNIKTLSPFQYSGFRGVLEYSRHNSVKISGGWYGMLSESFGMSATASYSHTDGFFCNEYNGRKIDRENIWSTRIKTEWRPSVSFSMQNTLSLAGLNQGGYPYESVSTGIIAYNDTCFYRRLSLTDGLTIKRRFNRFSILSITSLQYINDNMTLDQDFLPDDYFTLTQKKQEWGVTQDFVVRSDKSKSYSWVAGVFGFYRHTAMQAPVTFYDTGISRLIEEHVNSANPYYPIYWNERSFLLNSDFTNPVFGIAAYHQSELELGRWRLIGGLRIDYERTNLNYQSYCNTSYTIYQNNFDTETISPFNNVNVKIDDAGRLHKVFIEVLPKIGVVYSLSFLPMSNVYANVSKGYKAGGFNTQMFSDVLQQKIMGYMGVGNTYSVQDIVSYKPEKSWNYEIGAHIESFDSKLAASIALFYIDCRNQQLTVFPDGNTTGRIMTNAGKTRSYGTEISVDCRLLPRTLIRFSYGYTDARFRRFNNGIEDFSGKRIPYAPGNTFFVEGVYNLPLSDSFAKSLTFGVNLRGTGPIYWNESNTLMQNFYALLGATISMETPYGALELWGTNLTGTRYSTFYFVSIGNEFLQRGRPFNIGATLRINI